MAYFFVDNTRAMTQMSSRKYNEPLFAIVGGVITFKSLSSSDGYGDAHEGLSATD
jgi:hypothetical protein